MLRTKSRTVSDHVRRVLLDVVLDIGQVGERLLHLGIVRVGVLHLAQAHFVLFQRACTHALRVEAHHAEQVAEAFDREHCAGDHARTRAIASLGICLVASSGSGNWRTVVQLWLGERRARELPQQVDAVLELVCQELVLHLCEPSEVEAEGAEIA